MAGNERRRLALFDFDGTLFRLATDYAALRSELARLGGREQGPVLELIRELATDPRTLAVVDEAERRGYETGAPVARGIELYERFAAEGRRLAIVSHNGRAVIDEFLRAEGLPAPDEILDREALGASKEQSARLREYVEAAAADEVVFVGDAAVDRLAAATVGAEFIEIGADT
jgi:HAD superfamily hydrolase (TIGR01549 family)